MLEPESLIHQRYRVLREIGRGGMGAVYEARDERLDTIVAVKQTLMNEAAWLKAFEREARLLARLRHPALAKVSDYFSDAQGHFLVMEYIPGADLAKLLEEHGHPFPVDTVLTWADQVLAALEYLHSQEPPIIHRDIKPQNLKCTTEDSIILLDFGLAKGYTPTNPDASTTGASIQGYTPRYAPFEQIQSTGTDARSDLFAVGATLYHLLTNTIPANALARVGASMNQQPDPLIPIATLNPAVPPAVSAVIQRALALTPAERPPSATALRNALAAAYEGRNFATVLVAPDPEPPATAAAVGPLPTPATGATLPAARSWRRWMLPGAGLVLLGIALLTGLLIFSGAGGAALLGVAGGEPVPTLTAAPAAPPTELPPTSTATSVPATATPTPPPSPTPTPTPVVNDPSRYGELDADGQVTPASFPLPDDAHTVQASYTGGGGVVQYRTGRDSEAIADFYRQALAPAGGIERTLLTNLHQGSLSIVFDGWQPAQGRAVIIQTVPLAPDTLNVAILLDDV